METWMASGKDATPVIASKACGMTEILLAGLFGDGRRVECPA